MVAVRPLAEAVPWLQNHLKADLQQSAGGVTVVVKSKWKTVGWIVFCVAGMVGFAGLMLRAARMVTDGRGTEMYRTFWLVEFNWVGVLITTAVALIALLVALILRWREDWKWRELERKYGTRDPGL